PGDRPGQSAGARDEAGPSAHESRREVHREGDPEAPPRAGVKGSERRLRPAAELDEKESGGNGGDQVGVDPRPDRLQKSVDRRRRFPVEPSKREREEAEARVDRLAAPLARGDRHHGVTLPAAPVAPCTREAARGSAGSGGWSGPRISRCRGPNWTGATPAARSPPPSSGRHGRPRVPRGPGSAGRTRTT